MVRRTFVHGIGHELVMLSGHDGTVLETRLPAARTDFISGALQPSVTSVDIPRIVSFAVGSFIFGKYDATVAAEQQLECLQKPNVWLVATTDATAAVITLAFREKPVDVLDLLKPWPDAPAAVIAGKGKSGYAFRPARGCVAPFPLLHDTVARVTHGRNVHASTYVSLAKRVDPKQTFLLYEITTCAIQPEWYAAACGADAACTRLLSNAHQSVQLDGGYSFYAIERAFPLSWRTVVSVMDALCICEAGFKMLRALKEHRLVYGDLQGGNVVVKALPPDEYGEPQYVVRLIDLDSLHQVEPHMGAGPDPYDAMHQDMVDAYIAMCKNLLLCFEGHGKLVRFVNAIDADFIRMQTTARSKWELGLVNARERARLAMTILGTGRIQFNRDYCARLTARADYAGSIHVADVLQCVLDVAMLLQEPLFARAYATQVHARNMILWPYEQRIVIDPFGYRVSLFDIADLIQAFNCVTDDASLHVKLTITTLPQFIKAATRRVGMAKAVVDA